MGLRILPTEYQQRLEALQRKVKERELDVFLVSSFESIYYLTGAGFEPLERPFFLLVRPDRPPLLLVPKLDQEHMKKAHGIDDEHVVTYWEYPAPQKRSWPNRLKELIGGNQRIGVEPTVRREVTDQLPDYSLRTEPFVEQLRLIKSPAEVEMIQRAALYADFGIERLLAVSYFGSTVGEGFAETRTVSGKIAREVEDWDPLTNKVLMATWAAPHSAMPHSVPALGHRLADGPHVALVLTRVNGYSAESERTYFTAPPSREAQAAFGAMMEVRQLAFDMIKPGLLCSELDSTVNDFLGKEGYLGEDQRLHRMGHGIGLGTHEGPWLAEGSEDRLSESMVISVEPGIYLKGLGGLRHSDTVLITADGCKPLTNYATRLDSLVISDRKPTA